MDRESPLRALVSTSATRLRVSVFLDVKRDTRFGRDAIYSQCCEITAAPNSSGRNDGSLVVVVHRRRRHSRRRPHYLEWCLDDVKASELKEGKRKASPECGFALVTIDTRRFLGQGPDTHARRSPPLAEVRDSKRATTTNLFETDHPQSTAATAACRRRHGRRHDAVNRRADKSRIIIAAGSTEGRKSPALLLAFLLARTFERYRSVFLRDRDRRRVVIVARPQTGRKRCAEPRLFYGALFRYISRRRRAGRARRRRRAFARDNVSRILSAASRYGRALESARARGRS